MGNADKQLVIARQLEEDAEYEHAAEYYIKAGAEYEEKKKVKKALYAYLDAKRCFNEISNTTEVDKLEQLIAALKAK